MESITILTSLLFVWLKAKIDFEENFIKITNPNSILGFIPLGSKKFTVAINQIASVDSNFKLLFKDFVVGIIEAIISFSLFKENSILGFILLILGIITIINSFQVHINVNTTSGQIYYISAFVFQKNKIAEAEEAINKLISNRMDDTNNRKVSEVQTSAIVNAIKESK
ncbi:MAG: hypothetical protein J5747_00860 [Spirochaetaceae bacterium]|nr:hypothetical protein [Spirochaetaceae bacterium]